MLLEPSPAEAGMAVLSLALQEVRGQALEVAASHKDGASMQQSCKVLDQQYLAGRLGHLEQPPQVVSGALDHLEQPPQVVSGALEHPGPPQMVAGVLVSQGLLLVAAGRLMEQEVVQMLPSPSLSGQKPSRLLEALELPRPISGALFWRTPLPLLCRTALINRSAQQLLSAMPAGPLLHSASGL